MSDSITVPMETATLPGGGYLVNAPIDKIAVPENRLRELRDYAGLAASMEEIGLRQPITITEAGVLVSGRHRLEAARSLGWKGIPAFVVEDDALRNRLTEIDENLRRLDLTVYEQSKHAEERERVLEALGQRRKDGRHSNPATVAGLQKTTADIAAESGMSERSWRNRTKIGKGLGEKIRAVLDQADVMEEKHRNLLNSTTQLNHLADIANKRGDDVAAEVAEMALTEEGGNTFDAYKNMKKAIRSQEIQEQRQAIERGEAKLPEGVFEVISIDPPWPYGTGYDPKGRRAANPYPEMSLEEIAALDVPAAEDCVLWLWTTHKFMRHSFALLDGWGFRDVAILTWEKDRMGLGDWLRSKSEFCIMAVKGKPRVDLTNQTTVLHGRMREHSRKPEEFYELVDSLCIGRKLDFFSREARLGWESFGNDVGRFAS